MTNFNSKETYLAARAEWKANYARISSDVRAARRAYNEAQQVFSKTSIINNRAGFWAAAKAVNDARDARAALRREASDQMTALFVMKEEAARQWADQQKVLQPE
jgi:hypothetical protein